MHIIWSMKSVEIKQKNKQNNRVRGYPKARKQLVVNSSMRKKHNQMRRLTAWITPRLYYMRRLMQAGRSTERASRAQWPPITESTLEIGTGAFPWPAKLQQTIRWRVECNKCPEVLDKTTQVGTNVNISQQANKQWKVSENMESVCKWRVLNAEKCRKSTQRHTSCLLQAWSGRASLEVILPANHSRVNSPLECTQLAENNENSNECANKRSHNAHSSQINLTRACMPPEKPQLRFLSSSLSIKETTASSTVSKTTYTPSLRARTHDLLLPSKQPAFQDLKMLNANYNSSQTPIPIV